VLYGRLTFTIRGVDCELGHAWNLLPDGRIFDSTLALGPEAEDVQYWPDEHPTEREIAMSENREES
jgi:hypothetical protein